MADRWNPHRSDDLILHGLVERPGGAPKRSVRLRMNVLAISDADLQRLADYLAKRPAGPSVSPFSTWS